MRNQRRDSRTTTPSDGPARVAQGRPGRPDLHSAPSRLRHHPAPYRRPPAGRPAGDRAHEERGRLFRRIISTRSLETHFQPIVDLVSGATVGVEALSRFGQLPFRPPDAWFAEAAVLGLGVDLELTALDLALEQLDRLPAGMYLSMNASAEAMMSDRFRATLDGVAAERIVLELTEHTAVADYTTFAECTSALRSRGVRLAVDDAGSGHSSFTHVLNLRPEVIKLDISLIRGIDRDPVRQSLARALLGFGSEAFETTFVAEGIETLRELSTLRSLGFHSGQGFILGRPGRLAQRPDPASSRVRTTDPEGLSPA